MVFVDEFEDYSRLSRFCAFYMPYVSFEFNGSVPTSDDIRRDPQVGEVLPATICSYFLLSLRFSFRLSVTTDEVKRPR